MSIPGLTEMYHRLGLQKRSIETEGVDSPYWNDKENILEAFENIKIVLKRTLTEVNNPEAEQAYWTENE